MAASALKMAAICAVLLILLSSAGQPAMAYFDGRRAALDYWYVHAFSLPESEIHGDLPSGEQHPPGQRLDPGVRGGDDGVPAGARAPARASPHHAAPRQVFHGLLAGPDAVLLRPAQDDRRQQHNRGRRLHRILTAHHGSRPPRRRQGGGDRCEPGVLRAGPAGDREGRRRAQGGLPRGRRARGARQDPVRGRRRQGRHVRLRVRGRGQAAVRGVPRAAAAPGARRRRHRLRQHALGRLRGDAPRQAGQLRVRPPGAGQPRRVQRRRRRRRPRRGLHRPHRRRRHAVPPRQVKSYLV